MAESTLSLLKLRLEVFTLLVAGVKAEAAGQSVQRREAERDHALMRVRRARSIHVNH
jgi:hypothetical protein